MFGHVVHQLGIFMMSRLQEISKANDIFTMHADSNVCGLVGAAIADFIALAVGAGIDLLL